MGWRTGIQTVVDTIYPATCLSCDAAIDGSTGLCGKCWSSSPFISGLVCQTCSTPLIGTSDTAEFCDDCLDQPRLWSAARGVFLYEGHARKLILDLKYADRTDIAKAAGRWLLTASREILPPNPLVVPIPLHWTRLLKRKYNQSELLAQALASAANFEGSTRALKRIKRTPKLNGLDREEREKWLQGAIKVNPRVSADLKGRDILLVDDVMTSGATLEAATRACMAENVSSVRAVFLARAAKKD